MEMRNSSVCQLRGLHVDKGTHSTLGRESERKTLLQGNTNTLLKGRGGAQLWSTWPIANTSTYR